MSKLLKLLGGLGLSIVGSIAAYFLAESSIFAAWRAHNPVDTALNWLGKPVSVSRIVWWLVMAWSLATIPSAVFIWLVIRRKKLSDAQVVREMIGPTVHWDYKKGQPRDTKTDT